MTRKAKYQAVRLASRVGGTCPLTLPLQRNMQESPLNSIPPLQRGLQVGTQPLQEGMQVTMPNPQLLLRDMQAAPCPSREVGRLSPSFPAGWPQQLAQERG